MSLLSLNQIHLNIDPYRVALLKVSGWSRRTLHQETLDCPAMNDEGFGPQLELVKQLLEKYGKSSSCHIVLSNSFIRQLIIPDVDLSLSDKELEVLAKYCFLETYGQKADAWKVKVDAIHQVACAIDTALIEGLRVVCKDYGCQLQSIQSYLVSAFNQIRHLLGKQLNCLVQVEKSRLTVVLFEGPRWLRLSSVQYEGDWSRQLPSIIRREVLLSGLELQFVKIYVQHQQSVEPKFLSDDHLLKFEIAQSKPKFSSNIFAMSGSRT